LLVSSSTPSEIPGKGDSLAFNVRFPRLIFDILSSGFHELIE